MIGLTNVPKKADGVNAHAATHYADGSDPIDLAKLGAIPATDKGKKGGVATLGADGKVPSGQLPTMDYAAENHGHTFENINGVLPVEKGGTGVNSLDALASALGASKVVTGTYTGDNATSRTISLGFTPKAVLLMRNDGATTDEKNGYFYVHCGGLAISGSNTRYFDNINPSYDIITIRDNGFEVYSRKDTVGAVETNSGNYVYNYIAIASEE